MMRKARAVGMILVACVLSPAVTASPAELGGHPCSGEVPPPDSDFYRVCFANRRALEDCLASNDGSECRLDNKLRFDRFAGDFCFVLELTGDQLPPLAANPGVTPTVLRSADVAPGFLDQLEAVQATPRELSLRLARPATTEQLLELFQAAAPGTWMATRSEGFRINFVEPSDPSESVVEIQVLGPTDIQCSDRFNVGLRLSGEANQKLLSAFETFVDELAAAGVLALEHFEPAQLRNATTSWVIQSSVREGRTVFGRGLRGRDQVIALFDDIPDIRHCALAEQCDAAGRCCSKLGTRRPSTGEGLPSVHGTATAGILAGRRSDAPDDPRNGQAPEARISFAWLWDFASSGAKRTTFKHELETAYANGARVFSNSWGNEADGYTPWAYDIDEFTREREDALVIFSASNGSKVRSPENAKNALAVGASRQAELEEAIGSGGRGPTFDSRRKPEIFAPGCRIRAAAFGTTCEAQMAPGASRPGCVGAHCMPSDACATSWAAPAVAGAAALVRQYFVDGFYPSGAPSAAGFVPTGALLKAMLLNATRDMRPTGYPSDQEGWGRLVLEDSLFFAGNLRRTLVYDVCNARGFGSRPSSDVRQVRVDSDTQPLKVTLVWTEPQFERPGAPVVGANDLDLVVRRQGAADFYQGNDSERGQSALRNAATARRDGRNNVEQVLIERPTPDVYEIEVRGVDVKVELQGYALVVTGAASQITPSGPVTGCGPAPVPPPLRCRP